MLFFTSFQLEVVVAGGLGASSSWGDDVLVLPERSADDSVASLNSDGGRLFFSFKSSSSLFSLVFLC